MTPLPTHSCNSVLDEATGNLLKYLHLIKGPDRRIWIKSLANNLGRLAQSVGKRMPSGSNTIFFTQQSAIPADCKVSYARLVLSIRPSKTENHRVRVTAGGNRLPYPDITFTYFHVHPYVSCYFM